MEQFTGVEMILASVLKTLMTHFNWASIEKRGSDITLLTAVPVKRKKLFLAITFAISSYGTLSGVLA